MDEVYGKLQKIQKELCGKDEVEEPCTQISFSIVYTLVDLSGRIFPDSSSSLLKPPRQM